MDVSIVEGDHYKVIISYGNTPTLDDATFSLVDRCFDSRRAEFFLFCFRHRSESCFCTDAVKQFRIDAFLDTDKKD